jgi:hypothetical protein
MKLPGRAQIRLHCYLKNPDKLALNARAQLPRYLQKSKGVRSTWKLNSDDPYIAVFCFTISCCRKAPDDSR